ncbi:cytochrome P450 26C1-like isoform X3 [Hemiscyllium ocellatum]|uniref:cytochrome P450 26C1-like isoform X3 n=1 Tax=Hemiscyllium ocellatum TaxID=170820 RepID=UPI00296726BE|nr:cytochrome P450 26C1-like isoform X3 [Hemiscyllium ocellatum]
MLPLGLHFLAALGTALASLLSLLLLLAVSRQLWTLGWNVRRDRGNKLPLPKGSMGWPLLGETLHWMVQILARVFSHAALDSYLPGIQRLIRSRVRAWCREPAPVAVYPAAKALTFCIAVRVLLGLQAAEQQLDRLAATFEQLMENIFSLPVDMPFSGLRKGLKARDALHQYLETAIAEKLQAERLLSQPDALSLMLRSARENGSELNLQELKEAAVELIFAAFSTTASASTSLVLLLLQHSEALEKVRQELGQHGLLREGPGCECQPLLRLDTLSRLRYLDCVVKEVLRLLPPVSGGYRTALQTFELNGCQIPKGWNIIYSIRDTQETAAVYLNPDTFDPDRFGPERDESKAGRFNYLPFGGGVRSCVGRKLAQVILKTLAVELSSAATWELASATFPKMQTVPVVHPVDGLKVRFHRLGGMVTK